jgi:protein-S-isoprenylcysteine O-methyltransferase Ste14
VCREAFHHPFTEVDMFALLPIVGGLLAGWLASRKIAIALQVVFYLVAVAMLTASAPDHGGHYSDIAWIAPGLAVVSAGTLLIGLWLARRTARRDSVQP